MGHLAMSGRHFGLSWWRVVVLLVLVGRDQGWCQTPYNAQDCLPQQRITHTRVREKHSQRCGVGEGWREVDWGTYSASWGWANLELRWSLNWALNSKESGNGEAPRVFRNSKEGVFGELEGEQRIIGFTRISRTLSFMNGTTLPYKILQFTKHSHTLHHHHC